MPIPLWVNRYIGIPFKTDGLDERGCNCWGLVRLVLLRERSLDLPTYDTITAADLLLIAREMCEQSRHWRLVRSMRQPFDVLLMSGRTDVTTPGRAPIHCGVMVSSQEVLHIQERTASIAVSLTHPSVAFRMLGTYRHESLCA